ncbi:hypothetical protein ES708_33812 [subsurface metagenome]
MLNLRTSLTLYPILFFATGPFAFAQGVEGTLLDLARIQDGARSSAPASYQLTHTGLRVVLELAP